MSPVLSNVLLHEMDKELERRGYKFVRYANDLLILCRNRRSAERTMKSMTAYIEEKLFLKVNRDKSQTAYINKVKFLGYSFYVRKGGRLRIHPKCVTKMKSKLKELTSRSNGWGMDYRKGKLRQFITVRQFITGWINYFKLADMQELLKEVDRWFRRRLRMVIWKQWKRVRTRMSNLMKLGVEKSRAYQ